jgi:feruloyl esterase
MSDELIPTAGANNYYARVAELMGGYEAVRTFYRYYLIPGMGHCGGIGSVNGLKGVSPPADPPLPGRSQLFEVLVDWVETGKVPEGIVIKSSSGAIAHRLCAFPAKLIHTGGEASSASSYRCE